MATEDNESQLTLLEEENMTNCFIDDYSHLRLSYYQHRLSSSNESEASDYVIVSSGDTSESSDFVMVSSDQTDLSRYSLEDSRTTEQTDISDTSIKIDERQILRDYYISQIPDLPHPSFTVASIIASASQRMGGVHFKYNDRIEQGDAGDQVDVEFSPSRRSTLIQGQFLTKH
ncbi:uncharacterized protein LOC115445011 [Manduca sexta]|uniref:Uncharacterized protein n=1 Tax=Manduca sexta TaxID=7130 RepID=A0A921Z7R5_MANSE|nr:uncharacterized protein LOC115445011 [Manduca sexta]KAG6452455.1 hypothetical protein O3G_MSEX007625 [Manduca sexta]